jgi:hypothetical protein
LDAVKATKVCTRLRRELEDLFGGMEDTMRV